MVPPLPERIEIVQQICGSVVFSSTPWSRPLLSYLVQHPGVEGQPHRTAQAIYENVFKQLSKEPPYVVGDVRGRVGRLRDYLQKFFEHGPGTEMRWRVFLAPEEVGRDSSADHWELRFELNPVAEAKRLEANLLAFWEEFLAPGIPSRIVYGEPMFYTNSKRRRFVRNVARNFPRQLRSGLHAEYTFVTLGDLRFLLAVGDFFRARSVNIQPFGFLHESHIDQLDRGAQNADHEALIVIGSPRSNGAMGLYQQGDFHLRFKVNEDEVVLRKRKLRDQPHRDKPGIVVAHAVLTRRPSFRSDNPVVLVASNHGRAIQKIGEILTSPALFAELMAKPRLADFGERLPKYFQIAIRFEIGDHGRFVGPYEVLDAWDGSSAV